MPGMQGIQPSMAHRGAAPLDAASRNNPGPRSYVDNSGPELQAQLRREAAGLVARAVQTSISACCACPSYMGHVKILEHLLVSERGYQS